jgi:S-disulfanyl-L-cysteine oxidoreductase SoxD
VPKVLTLLFAILLCAVISLAVTQSMTETRDELEPEILEVIKGYGEQVKRGAEVYDLVCSNCHGNTGLGIEEGRAEFLPEHQKCEKCHRPFNAATLANVEISEKNAFNIGTPPALHSETLRKFGNATGLYAYISAAMPRHDPGTLSEQEYIDITAFLLTLNDVLPQNTVLTNENSSSITF